VDEVTLGLYSRETALGAGSLPVRRADVVFAPPDVSLHRVTDFPERFRRRVRAVGSRWALVHQPFAVRRVGESARLREITIELVFDVAAEYGRALWLHPTGDARTLAPQDVLPTGLADDLQPGSDGLVHRQTVVSEGTGRTDVRWEFLAQPGAPLLFGDGAVYTMLELAESLTSVTVSRTATALVEVRWLDGIDTLPAGQGEPAHCQVHLGPPPA
jgi:hypothetical protein